MLFTKRIVYIFTLFLFCKSVYCAGGNWTLNQYGFGNYTTITAWNAAQQGSLTTTGYLLITGSWTATQGSWSSNGWVTFSTAPLILQTTGLARHSGIWNDLAFRFVEQRQGFNAIVDWTGHITLDGIQMQSSGANDGVIDTNSQMLSPGYFELLNCIIKTTNTASTDGLHPNLAGGTINLNRRFKIVNCLFQGCNYGIISYSLTAKPTFYIYNNTFTGTGTGMGMNIVGASAHVKNNISVCTTKSYDNLSNFVTFVSSRNLSIDTTGYSPELLKLSPSFVNPAGGDWHIVNTDTSTVGGVNLSADSGFSFNTDIDGDIRTFWRLGIDDSPPSPVQSAIIRRKVYISE